jgi:hypothetical protein
VVRHHSLVPILVIHRSVAEPLLTNSWMVRLRSANNLVWNVSPCQ